MINLKKILSGNTLSKADQKLSELVENQMPDSTYCDAIEALTVWLRQYQLFSEDKIDRYSKIIMVYIKNCSPKNATTSDIKIASKYLAIYFYLNDQNSKDSAYAKLLQDILAAFEGKASAMRSNGADAVRDFMGSLKKTALGSDNGDFEFRNSIKIMLASFLEEHKIASGESIGLTAFRKLRQKTIAVTPYVELWSGLMGLGENLSGVLDREPLLAKAIRVISLSNDLSSVAEDISKGKPNEVLIYRDEMAVSLKQAHERISVEFERETLEVTQMLQEARQSSPSGIYEYCELLEICITGNINSMKALKERYTDQLDFKELEAKLPKTDGVMGLFQELSTAGLSRVQLATRQLSQECRAQDCYHGVVSRNTSMDLPITAPSEIFSSILILDVASSILDSKVKMAVIDWLSQRLKPNGQMNFFLDSESQAFIPDDVDCTAVGLTSLHNNGQKIDNLPLALDSIVRNINDKGVIQVYFPPRGERENRVDAVVCANVLTLLHQNGKQTEANATEDYLFNFLKEGLKGTRYYESPFVVLYFINRFISAKTTDSQTKKRFSPLIEKAFMSLTPSRSHALELALYTIVGKSLGKNVDDSKKRLTSLLGDDNLWPCEPFYKCGKSGTYFGSKSITTAFALMALLD
jgi:hypothetical protein